MLSEVSCNCAAKTPSGNTCPSSLVLWQKQTCNKSVPRSHSYGQETEGLQGKLKGQDQESPRRPLSLLAVPSRNSKLWVLFHPRVQTAEAEQTLPTNCYLGSIRTHFTL